MKHSDRPGGAKTALMEAAKRLLPERAPGAITGRKLADEAGVNYGLVHHHYGGKDAVLAAGLMALRSDFIDEHGDAAMMPLITTSDPYLRALVRANVDYPLSIGFDGEFPIAATLVDAVSSRLALVRHEDTHVEAQARAIAMAAIQLSFAVFGPALLDATGVLHRERRDVETALGAIYDGLGLVDGRPVEPAIEAAPEA